MTAIEPVAGHRQTTTLDELRVAMGELFGAERRLRGRDQQRSRDLTNSQLRALFVLGKSAEVTAGELAKSADLNPASVTAMLDQLEANGIVARRRAAHDRRVCLISLTDKGRSIVDSERRRWQALWEASFGDLSEPELSLALQVMRRMIALLDSA